MKLEFEKSLKSNFIKIRRVDVELFHANGQTDMTKLIVAFRNFANAPKRSCNPLQMKRNLSPKKKKKKLVPRSKHSPSRL
jgi:hypothetical protein